MEKNPTFFGEASALRAWFEEHHDSAEVLWLGYYKKSTGKPSVTWEETVNEALCFGWIDGVRKSRDDESYVIRFTPRRPKSVWSQRNIDQVEQLIADGLMQAAGLAAYAHKEAHPDSGYRVADDAELPEEMVEHFKTHDAAWAFYETQPPGYRIANFTLQIKNRQSARWVTSAKREETRKRRLATLIEDSANGLRIKQLRKR